ncbi:MAG: type II toxin-antitoxin system VapC family toxin [Thaumarchaeota archaeon]|nr:type II toxin-antitoxin system VapC family toxin [Nitrososphaerota archaeon]
MKAFLDSCFLIYLNAMVDDERRLIEELFRRLLEEQLFTNMLVVDEVLYISRKYGVSYETTLDFLKNTVLPYAEVLPVEEEDLKPVEKYLLKYGLKPSDAIHLATMEKAGISNIVSEDREFDRVKGIKRIWVTPNAEE